MIIRATPYRPSLLCAVFIHQRFPLTPRNKLPLVHIVAFPSGIFQAFGTSVARPGRPRWPVQFSRTKPQVTTVSSWDSDTPKATFSSTLSIIPSRNLVLLTFLGLWIPFHWCLPIGLPSIWGFTGRLTARSSTNASGTIVMSCLEPRCCFFDRVQAPGLVLLPVEPIFIVQTIGLASACLGLAQIDGLAESFASFCSLSRSGDDMGKSRNGVSHPRSDHGTQPYGRGSRNTENRLP